MLVLQIEVDSFDNNAVICIQELNNGPKHKLQTIKLVAK